MDNLDKQAQNMYIEVILTIKGDAQNVGFQNLKLYLL